MPWTETCVMDEKTSFIARLLDGETMTDACREFGISRKTGYKFWNRYQSDGAMALDDRTTRPVKLARLTPVSIQTLIVKAKERRPTWGANKLLVMLRREHPEVHFPVRSTVHEILQKHGFVKKKRLRSAYEAQGSELSLAENPNDLWCADYKGQYRLGNGEYCYPLTISDNKTRFLLTCDAHDSTKGDTAFSSFTDTFQEFGLPIAIRTDNGVPFASQSLFGLSRLSVWWMRLGIKIERIKPGRPDQNGQHERIHLTMKREDIVRKPESSFLKQQDAFELFRRDYNERRPHESLEMKCPADFYKPSTRVFPKELVDPVYDGFDKLYRVTKCGSVFTSGKSTDRIFLTPVLGHQTVGFKEEEDDIWLIRFMNLDLGLYDAHEGIFHRNDV